MAGTGACVGAATALGAPRKRLAELCRPGRNQGALLGSAERSCAGEERNEKDESLVSGADSHRHALLPNISHSLYRTAGLLQLLVRMSL